MVALICAGATDNRDLAARMGVTLATAKTMLHGIFGKTQRGDKSQLLLLCFDLFHPDN